MTTTTEQGTHTHECSVCGQPFTSPPDGVAKTPCCGSRHFSAIEGGDEFAISLGTLLVGVPDS